MTAVLIDIRRLDLSDLDAIDAIEQRAYPTPWSRAMFASELAKPTSICLGAFEGDELVGYIVNSRYVDAWHVMNVAVDPDPAGAESQPSCSCISSSSRRATSAVATRSRFASRTTRRSGCTSGSASSRAVFVAATTRTIVRTR